MTKEPTQTPLLLIGLSAFVLVAVGACALSVSPTPTPTSTSSPTAPVTTPTAPPNSINPSYLPSPRASLGPTATPIPSGDWTDILLSHVPKAIRPTCTVAAGEGPILARADCSVDDGNIQVIYFQYDGYDSMFNKYDSYRIASQIEPGTGDCRDHDGWPTEDGFNITGQLAGRWLCTEALGETSIYWTDNRLNILGQATQTVPDYNRFVQFWLHESGPDLNP